jgi:hypothetical protein
MRTVLRVLLICCLALPLSGCEKEPTTAVADAVMIFVYTKTFAAPLTVTVNGKAVGTIQGAYNGSESCGALVSADYRQVIFTNGFRGEVIHVEARFADGSGYKWDPFEVTLGMIRNSPCHALRIVG